MLEGLWHGAKHFQVHVRFELGYELLLQEA